MYTQQPPLDTVCNPYQLGILQLDCAVVGSGVNEIRWYFSKTARGASNENITLLSNSSKYTLLPYSMEKISGIQLVVHDLDEEKDSGYFWCQGFVSDGSLSISSVLKLLTQMSYPENAPACRQVVRNSIPTCASVITLPPEGLTTLVLTTSKPSPPFTTLGSTPVSTPTVMDPLSAFTTGESSASIMEQTGPPSSFEMSEFVLYVVIGLVTSLVVICICLAVVIIILCKKRCQGIREQQGIVDQLGL